MKFISLVSRTPFEPQKILKTSKMSRRTRRTRNENPVEEIRALSDSDNDCICIDVMNSSVVDLTNAPIVDLDNPPVVDLDNPPVVDLDNPPVVDLTCTPVRQTRAQGANDMSVVVIGTPDGSPRQRRRTRFAPIDVDQVENMQVDDDEIPECPFPVPKQTGPSSLGSHKPGPPSPMSPDPISCPVCLDDFKTIKLNNRKLFTTVCGHVFCNQCIEPSVKQQRCCPLCRKRLTMRNIFALHV